MMRIGKLINKTFIFNGNVIPIYSIKNFIIPNNKEKIIEIVLNNKKYQKTTGYSYPILDDESNFFDALYSKYYDLCLEKFRFEVHPKNKKTCWAYVSDKINYVSVWHNHIQTSTINGVYYLNIPGKTTIDFECDGDILSHSPSEYELIFFPNYLNHKPNVCYGDGYRISINLEITCLNSSGSIFNINQF